jgi:hypothetical protein
MMIFQVPEDARIEGTLFNPLIQGLWKAGFYIRIEREDLIL